MPQEKDQIVEITCKTCSLKFEMLDALHPKRKHWLKISKHYWKDIDWKNRTFTCSSCQKMEKES